MTMSIPDEHDIEPNERSFDAVDRLVRAHLDREAGRVDASRLQSRLRAALSQSTQGDLPAARRGPRSIGWPLAAAAATLAIGVFFGVRGLNPASANAATILRGARIAHSHGIDRHYRVNYAPDPRHWDRSKKLEGPSESMLWTRGDRFWSDCTIGGDIRLTIGREADGTIWISPSRKKGIRFVGDDSRVSRELAMICDINSMTVPALMDDVLADFTLRAEGPAADSAEATNIVWARLKPGRSHPFISAALLEIDARSDVLIRLVLWVTRDGRENGTVTFTLLDGARQDDSQYRLESHLDPDAEIENQRFGQGEPAPINPAAPAGEDRGSRDRDVQNLKE
jgi:hypothetical protein